MFQVQNITSDSRQIQTLVLPDGTQILIELYFMSQQLGWFITNLVYGNFVLNNLRITISPNMLYQWRNKLPFGLACFTDQNREPTQLEDFSSGAAKLFVLTQEEVTYYAEYLSGQVQP